MRLVLLLLSCFITSHALAVTQAVEIYETEKNDGNNKVRTFSDKPKEGAKKEVLEVGQPDPQSVQEAENRIQLIKQSNEALAEQLEVREQRKEKLKSRLELATQKVKLAEQNLNELLAKQAETDKHHKYQSREEKHQQTREEYIQALEIVQARSALLKAKEQQARIESEYYSYRVMP